jgi:hypothetical protein
MAEYEQPIRTQIDGDEFDGATLDMLRETLSKNKPELLRNAASELLTAKQRLDNLVAVIDKHLRELDLHWTAGDDAKTVKSSLRRLRDAAADVSTTITDQPVNAEQCPKNPSGVAPALLLQAHTLAAFSGDKLPESPDRDVSILEGAFQGGMVGTAGGAMIGAVPGAVIGAVVGTIAGGVTAIFTDGPMQNLFGDSKEEQDRKKAKEHIRLLTDATKLNNNVFPANLRTEIPQFGGLPPNVPTIPVNNGNGLPNGLPTGPGQPYLPASTGPGNLGYPNQDGLQDPSQHQIPGLGDPNLPGGLPDGTFPGSNTGTGPGTGPGTNLDGIGTGPGTGTNGLNTPGVTTPGATTPAAPNTSVDRPNTSLAGFPDPTALNAPGTTGLPNATTGIGSPYAGPNAGTGNLGVPGPANAAANAANAANAVRGMGGSGSSMVPMIPHGGSGGGQEQQERTRSTWLLEDEEYFRSDEATTNPYIRGESKGKA